MKFNKNIIFYISFIILLISLFKYIYDELTNKEIDFFMKRKAKYPLAKNFNLNYKGECGKIFKYKPHNSKDYVFLSFKYIPPKLPLIKRKLKILRIYTIIANIIDSYKKVLPNCKIICFMPKEAIHKKTINELKKNNIEVILKEGYEGWNIVNSRFFMIKEYLEKNKGKINRIMMADLTDVFVFGDIFSTFDENDLIINEECREFNRKDDKNCLVFGEQEMAVNWMNRSYPNEQNKIKNLINKRVFNINAGLILGGYNKILKFLNILLRNFDYNKKGEYGYDQSTLLLKYYDEEFKDLNITLEQCTQRMCLDTMSLLSNKKTTEIYYSNGCSPVIIHKGFPKSWKKKTN